MPLTPIPHPQPLLCNFICCFCCCCVGMFVCAVISTKNRASDTNTESNERRDESVLGVAFFKRYGQDHAEVGCLAIHRDYRKVWY